MSVPIISIERYANVLHISPATIFEVIKPAVTFQYRRQVITAADRAAAFKLTGNPSARVIVEPRTLAWFENSLLFTFAGLYNRVVKRLTELGYRWQYIDYRKNKERKPNYARLKGQNLTSTQKDVIAAISVADMGVIKAPPGYGKSHLIRMICMVFDEERIAVVVPTRIIARQMYRELINLLGEHEVGRAWTGYNDIHKRVIVVVVDSLGKLELPKLDMVLFDEVHTAAATETSKVLVKITNARLFGFSASPIGRSDNSDLMTEALFGPIIYEISYDTAVEENRVVPITVHVYNIDECVVNVSSSNLYTLNRHGIWCNDCRNSRIAQIVRQIEETNDGQILILCDKGIHAYHLKQFLPEYEVVVGKLSDNVLNYLMNRNFIDRSYKSPTSKQLDKLADAFASGELKKVIATDVWGTGFDVPGLSCVVRADGRSNPIVDIQRPGRVTRTYDGKEAGVVIDFYDSFHPTLEGRSKRRISNYKKLGWRVIRL